MSKLSVKDQVMEVLKNFPNSTCRQVEELIASNVGISAVSAQLSNLYNQGLVLKDKVPNPTYTDGKGRPWLYSFRLNPDPSPTPPPKVPRLKKPTQAGWEARIAEKDAQIAELVRWQTEAIARYPDLAVPPIIMRARKIVASILKNRDDKRGSDDAMAGRLDNTALIQTAVAALEAEAM